MTIRALLITGVLATGLGIAAPAARANVEDGTYWSMPAVGCVPGTLALSNESYATWLNYVSWNGTSLDTLAFWCPVTPGDYDVGGPNPNRLYLTALDSDGSGSSVTVTAKLYRVSKTGGGYTQITSVTSNSSSVHRVSVGLGEALDFATYYYYVRVELARSSSSYDGRFYGVSLENYVE